VPVRVRVELTEIGTLELWCEALHSDHRWRLEFAVDEEDAGRAPSGPTETVPEATREEAAGLVRACFGPARSRDPGSLAKDLERATDLDRERWPPGLLRGLWDVLAGLADGRTVNDQYEARWLNLAGYLLRPGFGDPLDAWRIGRLWRLFARGALFADKVENRVQWWILWRRIAGGLDREKQEEVYGHLAPVALREKGRAPASQELSEIWSCLGALELLPARKREELGAALVGRIDAGRAAQRDVFALARFGARAPLYGPYDEVLAPKGVEKWLRRLLQVKWPKDFRPEFAFVHMARFTGDRARDIDEELREEIAGRIGGLPQGQALVDSLFQVKPLSAQEERQVFGDTIPLGLRLR
jgi:hypothetical protein